MNDYNISPGVDAVFLPGKIHGCEWQVYIIYLNESACNGRGCFEIEILDNERIIDLYEHVEGDPERFFELLPDWLQGEWYYCNISDEGFNDYLKSYNNADFILGRDGSMYDEMMFLVRWARS